MRDAFERHVGRRLARRATTGPAASRTGARSDVVLSVISGVLLMGRVVGARALDERNADHLVELLEAVFGAVVDTRLS